MHAVFAASLASDVLRSILWKSQICQKLIQLAQYIQNLVFWSEFVCNTLLVSFHRCMYFKVMRGSIAWFGAKWFLHFECWCSLNLNRWLQLSLPLDLLNLIFLIHSRLAEIAMPQRHMLRAQIHKYTHKMHYDITLPACHYYNPKNNTQTLRITQRVKKVCLW